MSQHWYQHNLLTVRPHNLMHVQSAAEGWFTVANGNKSKSSASSSLM